MNQQNVKQFNNVFSAENAKRISDEDHRFGDYSDMESNESIYSPSGHNISYYLEAKYLLSKRNIEKKG